MAPSLGAVQRVALEDKLRQLRAAMGLPAAPACSLQSDLDALLGGRVHQTSQGPCYLIERRLPLDQRHGCVPVGAGRRVSARALMLLARAARVPEGGLERAVFLSRGRYAGRPRPAAYLGSPT